MPFDPISFALAKKAMRSPPLSDVSPVTQAVGDTASAGTGGEASRQDHRHGMPAAGIPVTQAEGDAASEGVAATLARSDHRHGMPSSYTPTAPKIWILG